MNNHLIIIFFALMASSNIIAKPIACEPTGYFLQNEFNDASFENPKDPNKGVITLNFQAMEVIEANKTSKLKKITKTIFTKDYPNAPVYMFNREKTLMTKTLITGGNLPPSITASAYKCI
ncbi:MAG: hypothetical protein GQ546_13280 [Gammaproteobacteria bacterium]|nr:hypothetical protein [Gammaproteobacteria bacterium]